MISPVFGLVFTGVGAVAGWLAFTSESRIVRWLAVSVAFWAGVGDGTYLVLNAIVKIVYAKLGL